MKKDGDSRVPEGDNDEVLARNFIARMKPAGATKRMSVETLRQAMRDHHFQIGNSTIQSAMKGWRGISLASLQKFADYFGCTVSDLLTDAADARGAWPFSVTPEQVSKLDAALLASLNTTLQAFVAASGEPLGPEEATALTGTRGTR